MVSVLMSWTMGICCETFLDASDAVVSNLANIRLENVHYFGWNVRGKVTG
jgi:hypothetical protein